MSTVFPSPSRYVGPSLSLGRGLGEGRICPALEVDHFPGIVVDLLQAAM